MTIKPRLLMNVHNLMYFISRLTTVMKDFIFTLIFFTTFNFINEKKFSFFLNFLTVFDLKKIALKNSIRFFENKLVA